MPRPFLDNEPKNDKYYLIQEQLDDGSWKFFRNANDFEKAYKIINGNPETKLRVFDVTHDYKILHIKPITKIINGDPQ